MTRYTLISGIHFVRFDVLREAIGNHENILIGMGIA